MVTVRRSSFAPAGNAGTARTRLRTSRTDWSSTGLPDGVESKAETTEPSRAMVMVALAVPRPSAAPDGSIHARS